MSFEERFSGEEKRQTAFVRNSAWTLPRSNGPKKQVSRSTKQPDIYRISATHVSVIRVTPSPEVRDAVDTFRS